MCASYPSHYDKKAAVLFLIHFLSILPLSMQYTAMNVLFAHGSFISKQFHISEVFQRTTPSHLDKTVSVHKQDSNSDDRQSHKLGTEYSAKSARARPLVYRRKSCTKIRTEVAVKRTGSFHSKAWSSGRIFGVASIPTVSSASKGFFWHLIPICI